MKPLRPCPDSPNCVSSLASPGPRRLDPIPYKGDAAGAQRRLEDLVRAWPRARIVHSEPGYFAVEFRSLVFRFVDEAEFSFDTARRLIHFRSGARTGYADFGVNGARMRKLAAAFQKA